VDFRLRLLSFIWRLDDPAIFGLEHFKGHEKS
jgi:hypothetical protein